jgi:hypothetical protein
MGEGRLRTGGGRGVVQSPSARRSLGEGGGEGAGGGLKPAWQPGFRGCCQAALKNKVGSGGCRRGGGGEGCRGGGVQGEGCRGGGGIRRCILNTPALDHNLKGKKSNRWLVVL